MAQEKPNPWVQWLLIAQQQGSVVKQRLRLWLEAVREEPSLIWQTIAIRYTVYLIAGTTLLFGVKTGVRSLTPPPPADARPQASTADFHVICINPNCAHHFVIHREFGFSRFPVKCPECQQVAGMRSRRCFSPTCKGRWVVPKKEEAQTICPRCGQHLE